MYSIIAFQDVVILTKPITFSVIVTLQAFGDAYRLVAPAEEAGKILSPYVIYNNTGNPVTLKLDNAFEVSSYECVSLYLYQCISEDG